MWAESTSENIFSKDSYLFISMAVNEKKNKGYFFVNSLFFPPQECFILLE